ncbi:Serine/threonine protein phosphatase 2A 57 kDa regulatory subunit B' theta isoform [Babesia sp. Xinjiang]|uniref:Serine/threonine protein phosphatase 2A 57 kDa regulatory subunit B' theta isoform n=1 Tax=Babesia sp. Xinjiang TaxID=462227 RepID=UPI000A2171D3|nr:Serine/threonine protein phosphatase 2A 57 kDa regulatory subunit B' theta isoform [Babesia sp. Xinjiang]ORM40431.1 Serine/threonine protein phosphatase 2A 57 kDa regulatory subunit B' theta isoform [Babesia sp. Xinjiang]
MSRSASRASSRGSHSLSGEEDGCGASPQSYSECDSPSGWWLYSQTRRLFRSFRDRKSDEVQKNVSEGDSRPEAAPQRSIFRMLSGIFMKNQESDDDGQSKGSVPSTPASPDLSSSTPVRRRRRWRSHSVSSRGDSDTDRALSDSDCSSGRSSKPVRGAESLSDNEYQIHRSLSSASLSSNALTAVDHLDGDSDGGHVELSATPPARDAHGHLGPLDDSMISARGSADSRRTRWLVECFDALRKGASDSSSDEGGVTDSSFSHGQSRTPSHDGGSPRSTSVTRDVWLDGDDDNGEDRGSRHSERRRFSFRNSISSFRRNKSSPKYSRSTGGDLDMGVSKSRGVRGRHGSHYDRDDSVSSLSDPEKSPVKGRGLTQYDYPSAITSWRPDTPHVSDGHSRRGASSSIKLVKERVVVLTSKAPSDHSIIPPSLSNWDAQSVRKLEEVFSRLPLLKDTPMSLRGDLFQRKLIACQTVIDFNYKRVLQRAIELKRQTLLEIIEYISTARNCLNEGVLRDVIDMVSANVFRSLPPRNRKNPFSNDIDEDEPSLEKSWPHLQIVYDVFLRVVVSNDVSSKMAKNMIDKPFVTKLLSMLNSEDQRERDYLKTILHRIYGKIMSLRTFIRKSIDNVFTSFIYESGNPYGITELLEILGSIINGFAVPLKEEHKVYLEKSLAPLHKPSSIRSYHAALSYCMIQYINKDRSLASLVLKAILNFWPSTSAQNEILFLNELEEVLSLTELTELNDIIRHVAIRLSQCTCSTHFQVSERALYIWNNDRVSRLLHMHKKVVYPYMVPALRSNMEYHWNDVVRNLTYNVAGMLMDHDQALYSNCISSSAGTRLCKTLQSFSITPLGSFGSTSSGGVVGSSTLDLFLSPRDIGLSNVPVDNAGVMDSDSHIEQHVDSGRSRESESVVSSPAVPDTGRVQREDSGSVNFTALTSSSPVCYCVYEEVAQGTFYLQWKGSTSESISNHVMMFLPGKTVPKFKLVNDGGRSELATRVMPDKHKFWSSLCLFIKTAKEYKSKLQLFPGWNDRVPYKSDIYFHDGSNTVTKVGYDPIDLENVAAIGIAGRSNLLMANKMSKEQFSQGIRKGGYCLQL